MVGAIGFFRDDGVAAETEILFSRFAIRPAAHAGAKRLEADDLGRFRLLPDRRPPFRKPQAVNLADDGVLGDTEPCAHDAGGEAFFPQGNEDADACWRPFF